MVYVNKIHLGVKKDLNGWYNFSKGKYRVQLCGHSGKGGFFLSQHAEKLGKKDFMKDFTEILESMEKDNNQAIFSLYVLPDVINGIVEEE